VNGASLRAAVSAAAMGTHTLRRFFARIPVRWYIPIGLAAMNGGIWTMLITIHGLRLLDLVAVLAGNAGLGLAAGTFYGLLRGAIAVLDRRLSDLQQVQEQQAAAMDFVLSVPGRPRARAETYQ
jgi:hypothetical protein